MTIVIQISTKTWYIMVKAISVKKTKAIQFSALTQSIWKRKAPRRNIRVMVIHATSIRHNEHKHCPSYHTNQTAVNQTKLSFILYSIAVGYRHIFRHSVLSRITSYAIYLSLLIIEPTSQNCTIWCLNSHGFESSLINIHVWSLLLVASIVMLLICI